MLTITFLPFICFNNKRSYIYTIFLGITYDLLYSNIYLYNVILFIFLISIDQKIMKYFKLTNERGLSKKKEKNISLIFNN